MKRCRKSDDDIRLLDNVRDNEKSECLISLVQKLGMDLQVEINPKGVAEKIAGQLQDIRLDDLSRLGGVCRDALSRMGLFQSEMINVETYLNKSEGEWYRCLILRVSGDGVEVEKREKSKKIISKLLSGILSPAGISSKSLIDNLDEFELSAVNTVATEFLLASGGKTIQAEIDVEVAGELVGRASGRINPKPDRSDFRVQEIELSGVFDGFSIRKEKLIFLSDDLGEIELNFGRQVVDFRQLVCYMEESQRLKVKTHRTLEKNGKPQFGFVRIVELLAVPDGVTDLLTQAVAIN
jgi:hypothetical protein